ncbi:MAG: hypothetical protein HC872_06980 [Gammaproteobacteria bacterium]|nr:hypothetical protein [Gammaproteobacteria bacterium]
MISGVVCTVVTEPADIIIEIAGHPASAIVELEPRFNGSTHFTGRLTEDADIEAVERVAVVTVRIGHHSTTATVPYQVERLAEQDTRRVDADRLRHAAQLELDDPDLEQALAALEEILICDNVTRWSHQRPAAGNSPDTDAATINWADIDWNAVRRHPTFASYGGPNGIGAAAGSDLAAYLEGMTQVVRELTEPPSLAGHHAHPPSEPDDNDDKREIDDVSAGIEGVDIDDAADNLGDDNTDVTPAKRQSAVTRNRRLIRIFVRRNLQALENPTFRQGAGPGVTILNIIILNWICLLAATKDTAAPADLIEERLRLWRLLWGDDDTQPYLDDLDENLQLLALEQFDDQRFEAVTVASMTDILTHAHTDSDSRLLQLRSILRHAVSHPSWQVTATHLTHAARVINSRTTATEVWNAGDIATTLWNASCRTLGERDLRHNLASTLNVDQRAVELRNQNVIVDQTRTPKRVREAFIAVDELKTDIIERTFATWQSAEQRKHYRIRWHGGIAQYNATTHAGWIYRNHDDMRTDLERIDATHPIWRIQLDMLVQSTRAVESPPNRLTIAMLA